MDVLLGTNLGGYTLKRRLGSGGMGTVYLAEDPAIGQQVAIKLVHTDDSEIGDSTYAARARARFRQEARAVAALDHLHILPLYRYGEEETAVGLCAYIVMQYRAEGSLADWLRARSGLAHSTIPLPSMSLFSGLPTSWPLAPDEVAEYIRQAASALQYAHDRGIVHRDVKPANFLLRTDVDQAAYNGNKVLLLLSDFGLAKFYASSSSTSSVFGTPTYMSPEQFDGHAVPSSDQYALAVTAYYLLAGHLPFEGEPIHLMYQHLDSIPPPILKYAPALPPEADRVLSQALAKRPTDRFPSINHFARAFMQALNVQESTLFQGMSPSSSSGFNFRAGPGPDSRPMTTPRFPRRITKPRLTAITPPPRNAEPPADMHTPVGYTRGVGDNATSEMDTPADAVMVTDEARTERMQVVRPEPARLVPPPDQPVDKSRVKRRKALGWIAGGAAVLVAVGAGAGLYFNIAGLHNDINAMLPAPAPPPDLQHHDQPPPPHSNTPNIQYLLHGHTQAVTSVAWSPNGALLASASVDTTARLWNTSTQKLSQTYRGHTQEVTTIAWNSAGDQLASGGRDRMVQVWGTDTQITHGPFNLAAIVNAVAWVNSGSDLFVGTSGGGVEEIVLSSNTVDALRLRPYIRALAVSPDGRYLATGAEAGFTSVYTLPDMNLLYTSRSLMGAVTAMSWSPDSTLLAYGGENMQVIVFDVNAQIVRATLTHTSAIRGIAWHPTDTNRLATVVGDNVLRVWTLNPNANKPYQAPSGTLISIGWHQRGLATGTSGGTIIVWNV